MNWLKIRPVKYITTGGVATTLNLLAVYLLTDWLTVYYLVSSVVGFGLGLLTSFLLQKFWPFEDHSRDVIHWQALIFTVTALVGLGLNTVLVYSLVQYLGQHYLLAQVLSGGIIAILNFLVYQKLIFPDRFI